MADAEIHDGRVGEGSFVKVGSVIIPDQGNVSTADEAEQQYYKELFRGFSIKFSRWQAVLEISEEFRHHPSKHWVSIFTSPNGLYIANPFKMPRGTFRSEDEILNFQSEGNLYHPPEEAIKLGMRHQEFIARPGKAARHLLVDMNGKPILEARIRVTEQMPVALYQGLEIHTELPPDKSRSPNKLRKVEYWSRGGKFGITRGFGCGSISDVYASHLIDTIDSLIPNTIGLTQPNERRTTSATQIPKALPRAR